MSYLEECDDVFLNIFIINLCACMVSAMLAAMDFMIIRKTTIEILIPKQISVNKIP